ncbi:unnamed protein product [Chrysoparadoxa australica]
MKYGGVLNTLRVIWAEEGIRGCYTGITPALICVPIFWSIYFGLYEGSKAKWRQWTVECPSTPPNLNYLGEDQPLLSSVTSAAITDVATSPFWVVRTRMQTQALHDMQGNVPAFGKPGQGLSMVSTFRSIHHSEGIMAFYRGLSASFLGLGHVAIQFPVYEKLKAEARRRSGGPESTPALVAASAFSKLIANIATYPHEVLRSRMQDERGRTRQRTLQATARRIIQQNGFRGLYTGFRVNLCRVVPSCIATFYSYEQITRLMMKAIEDRER